MKKIFVLLLILLAVVPLSACGSKKSMVAVQSISFYEPSIQLVVGASTKLEYKIFPTNATNQKVQFASSDPSAVSVDENGMVTLNRSQSALITVSTIDGLYHSTCLVEPLTLPTSIELDTTKTEQKWEWRGNLNETSEVLMMSVGQTKLLPVTALPEGSTTDMFEFKIDSLDGNQNSISIEKGAKWQICANSQGRSRVTVYAASGSEQSVSFEVCVGGNVDKVKVYNNGSELNVKNNKASISLNLEEASINKSLVRLELINEIALGENSLEQVAISSIVSDNTIFDAQIVDSWAEYNEAVGTNGLFNSSKYIVVTPKADGIASLFVVTDAADTDGNPVSIEIEVAVSRVPDDLKLSIDTGYVDADGVLVVEKGQSFSIDVQAFLGVAGGSGTTDYQISIAERKVFFELANTECVSIYNQIGASYRTQTNLFMAKEVSSSPVEIRVYVAKSIGAQDYDGSNGSEYITQTIEVGVAKPVIGVVWGFVESDSIVWQLDGSEIAISQSAVANLKAFCLNGYNNYTEVSDSCWSYHIVSDNTSVIEVSGANLTAKSSTGYAKLTISLSDGQNVFVRDIFVTIIQQN